MKRKEFKIARVYIISRLSSNCLLRLYRLQPWGLWRTICLSRRNNRKEKKLNNILRLCPIYSN